MKLITSTLLTIFFFQLKAQEVISFDCDTLQQQEMNFCIYNKYQKLDSLLYVTRLTVVNSITDKETLDAFITNHNSWLKFRETNSIFYQNLYKGGTLETYFKYLHLCKATQSRIEELKDLLSDEIHKP